MTASGTWYAGRIGRGRGNRSPVDVLASAGTDGWKGVPNTRKLFPRNGQVELLGRTAIVASAGEWLAFQVVSDPRPGAHHFRVGPHRLLPRFTDMRELGTIEAARYLFTREGWVGPAHPGLWAVRFSEDRILAIRLDRRRDGRLRCSERSLDSIACHAFDEHRLGPEPVAEYPRPLYDLGDEAPLAIHDWSPGADYVAHVIRALAGADDPRLPELITWLELHRDEKTGRISAIGTDQDRAFEALRSGEFAARLSADREVMAAYLDAVRDDPHVAAAVEKAAREEMQAERKAVRAEMAAEREAAIAAIDVEVEARRAKLEAHMHDRLASREREFGDALKRRIAEQELAAARAIAAERDAVEAALQAARADLISLDRERESRAHEVETLKSEARRQEERVRASEGRLAAVERKIASGTQRLTAAVRPLAAIADSPVCAAVRIERAELGRRIAGCVLLTECGKQLMTRLVAYMLAGEIPILEGPHVEDFSFVAEALVAAGRLIPFDADPTIVAPDDIWSRPGSGLPSQVAQAATLASEGQTFLVQLGGVDRSAARSWHPALSAVARRGLLPRPLLIFATLADPASEEAAALPSGTCRMIIEDAVVDAAALVAPGLLGAGANAIALQLDPGERPDDLSGALVTLPTVADAGLKLDVATSIRVARVATEAAALAPNDAKAAFQAALSFCRDIRRGGER